MKRDKDSIYKLLWDRLKPIVDNVKLKDVGELDGIISDLAGELADEKSPE